MIPFLFPSILAENTSLIKMSTIEIVNISNKQKDLLNTYGKVDEGRTIPITTPEHNKPHKNDSKHQKDDEISDIQLNTEFEQIDPIMNVNEFKEQAIDNSVFDELLNKTEQLEKERDDLKDQLLRRISELENIRKRSIKEK